MKRLTLLAAVAALGIGGVATAQMTTQEQHVAPNGAVRTTTTHVGPMGGVHETTRVDRPDGTTRVIQRDERMVDHRGDNMGRDHMGGDMRMHDRGWHRGWNHRQVCKVTWHHGHRMRRCWNR